MPASRVRRRLVRQVLVRQVRVRRRLEQGAFEPAPQQGERMQLAQVQLALRLGRLVRVEQRLVVRRLELPELQRLMTLAQPRRVQLVLARPQPAPQLAEQSLREPTSRGQQQLERVEPGRRLRRRPAHEHRWQREFPRSVGFQPVVQSRSEYSLAVSLICGMATNHPRRTKNVRGKTRDKTAKLKRIARGKDRIPDP